MLRFFAPVSPAGERLKVEFSGWFRMAMRAAQGSCTPIDTVLAWPWARMLLVWAEGRDMHAESWGLLLKVHYRFEADE